MNGVPRHLIMPVPLGTGSNPAPGGAQGLLRILVTTHYWHPHRGGIENVAREQAMRLAGRGHRVSVLTSRLRGDPALQSDRGVEVHRVTSVNPLERVGVPVPVPTIRLRSTTSRLVSHADVVVSHGHIYPTTVAASWAAAVHQRPLILVQHNPFIDYRAALRVAELGADFFVGRPVLRRASRVLAVSATTAAYVERISARRDVSVLPNGVDAARFCPAPTPTRRAEIRRELGLPLNATIILTVRRLTYRNGLDTLIDAVARLKPASPMSAVIVGDGPDRGSLQERVAALGVSDRFVFAGLVSDDELPDWYRAADLFVLPTRTGEGFGLVLAEAMASGIGTIATDGGAQRELVSDGESGWLVPADEPGLLARQIERLLRCPAEVARAGQLAREAAQRLDWETNVDQLEACLREAVAGRRALPPAQHPSPRHDRSSLLRSSRNMNASLSPGAGGPP